MSLAYAIGDVHGMYSLMFDALEEIAKRPSGRIIFLGDLIDRGRCSRQCVEYVKDLHEHGLAECIAGNHEYMMHTNDGYIWNMNGGRETLQSYGDVDMSVYEAHVQWMKSLPAYIDTGKHFFVHGGIDPGLSTEQQDKYDMMWARYWQDDIDDELGWHGRHVVYGHTPYKVPKLMKHSSGLDTGAVYGGALSVGIFDLDAGGGPIEVLQFR